EYLRSPKALFAAAGEDRADVVEFLLEMGVPLEIEDANKQRALHVAAARDAVRVAELLIARGAEIDPVEAQWSNTPLDTARWYEHQRVAELLAPHSRDLGSLAALGRE